MWELLRDRQLLGFKFRRQHQIGDYIADFYCHDARLVVEIDGSIHETREKSEKDKRRDKPSDKGVAPEPDGFSRCGSEAGARRANSRRHHG
jgi:very-short-patch-repair endonuclease